MVNDLGGSAEGEGGDKSVAEQVVDEIRKAGGNAIANGDSVTDPEGCERMVKSAVQAFGRIDCVVNNAGILRDRIFHRMSVVDFDAVIKVHLYGSFYMSKAAAPYFKEQESGSFVHFTSTSGLIGNFGQANYSAAKMGIIGLSKSIALDMAKFNVRSNCVSPFAWSRLIGTIPTDTPEQKARVERMQNTMTAAKIAPLCVFLAADAAKDVSGSDLRRAQGRDLPDVPVAPDPRRAQGRRLDAGGDRRRRCCRRSRAASTRSTARQTCSTGSRCEVFVVELYHSVVIPGLVPGIHGEALGVDQGVLLNRQQALQCRCLWNDGARAQGPGMTVFGGTQLSNTELSSWMNASRQAWRTVHDHPQTRLRRRERHPHALCARGRKAS